jgi:hypothetical protein
MTIDFAGAHLCIASTLDKKMKWYRILTGQSGYPQPDGDFGYLDATYDLSDACPTCGVGKKQENPFRFKSEPKARRRHFLGLNWVFDQIFIQDEIKEKIEAENIQGISFSRPVIHKSGEPMVSIYQLHVETYLSAPFEGHNLRTEICEKPKDPDMLKFLKATGSALAKGPFCGQRKFNYPKSEDERICIHSSSLNADSDAIRMNEWFGSGGSSGQPILFSERFKNLIERMAWRGISFYPIDIIQTEQVQPIATGQRR